MSLLNEFNKQLSSASEQLERLERLEAEQQQEDGKEIKKKQQQQQPQSIKQRTPHGVVGYSGLHLKKNSNFSSAAATPNMDPIAAKHLQPNPIRYAKTTITDRLDSNYRALSSLQDQASPTRIAVENDRNRKKFEYLNNKIKALDERVSSMNNIHSSNATPSISGIEAIDFEIQELKANMKKVLENDLRSDQDSNKSKYASPSLQMDHVYDVVYSRLRTQLQDIVHEVFQQHSKEQMSMLHKIVDDSVKPSQEELFQRIEALEEELIEARTELHTLKNKHNEENTTEMRLLELRDMCIQIDKDCYETSKQLYDRMTAIESSLTETKISHEQSWAILESKLEKSIEKSSIAQTSVHNVAKVVEERISDMQDNMAVVSAAASKASIMRKQSPSLASPAMSPSQTTLMNINTSLSSSLMRSPLKSQSHQRSPMGGGSFIQDSSSPSHKRVGFYEEDNIIYNKNTNDIVSSLKASIQQVLEEIDVKLQGDTQQIENFKQSLNILDTRLTRTENAFIKNLGSNGNGHTKNVPSSMISSHVNREFESKFEAMLADKLNESWGAFGLNTTIDEIKSDVFSLDRDLRELRQEVDVNTKNRSKIMKEVVEICNETTRDIHVELHRELQVVAKAILHLSGHEVIGPDGELLVDSVVNQVESSASSSLRPGMTIHDQMILSPSQGNKISVMDMSPSSSSSPSSTSLLASQKLLENRTSSPPTSSSSSSSSRMVKNIEGINASSNSPVANKFDSIKCSPRILIKASERQPSIGSMMITNGNQSYAPGIAYRLEVTHPDIILITQERKGFVAKGQSIMIQVVLRPLYDLGFELKNIVMNNDVFVQVEVVFISDEDINENDPTKFWDLFDFQMENLTIQEKDDHNDDESYRISVGVHAEEAFGGRVPGAGIGGIQDAVGSASGSVTRRLRISP